MKYVRVRLMCCEGSEEEHLPPVVRAMLDRYRAWHAERGWDWGIEFEPSVRVLVQFASWCDQDQLAKVLFVEIDAPGTVTDPVEALLGCVARPLPAGLAIATRDGIELPNSLPWVIPDRSVTYQVLVVPDDGPGQAQEAQVSAADPYLRVNGHSVLAAVPAKAGSVRVVSDAVSRWTLADERGGGWFPDDVLVKYDADNVSYFHAGDVVVTVPTGQLTVRVARGCEFRPVETAVEIVAGHETVVELVPERLYDAASQGWYGGDLHVHLNWSGDQVCTPRDAALMQHGEGLHLMNLLAANGFTSVIYDREAFEHYLKQDLPWSTSDKVARWGVEYRNDLLGHFTALNPSAPPSRYQTGHRHSDQPQDWPPNAVAAAEFRDHGATIGYTHPFQDVIDNGDPSALFADHRARSTEARELVADAALGLVDSIDLGGPCNLAATEYVYHRLLGCGLRLAVTAGTDVMLSYSRSALRSNPPGWCRAYANLAGVPLSVEAWQDAVRAGRTFTTNGPWLELDVAGHGIGHTLELAEPGIVPVTARVVGLGVRTLDLVGPDGVIATAELTDGQEHAELTTTFTISEPVWLAAVARGGDDQPGFGTLDYAYAHTSPTWIDVASKSVARADDARWCLNWLDRVESLARSHGTFTDPGQLDDLVTVLDNARSVYHAIAT